MKSKVFFIQYKKNGSIYFRTILRIRLRYIKRKWLRALSNCQNWPARPFLSLWEFHFKLKLTIQISQILNIMHRGDGFSAKLLGKSIFDCQNVWSGHSPAGQFWLLESALSWDRESYICPKVTKMGSKIGHRIDYNGTGAVRRQRQLTQVPPYISHFHVPGKTGTFTLYSTFLSILWGRWSSSFTTTHKQSRITYILMA